MAMHPEQPLIGVNLLYIRPGYMGGTVRYAYELLKHLNRIGRHRLVVYVQKNSNLADDPALCSIPRREFRVVGGLASRVFIEHVVLPYVVQKDGVDLLFSPGFVSPLWGRFRKVVTIHDLYYFYFPQFVRPWQRRYLKTLLPLSLLKANAAIAVSDSTRKDIVKAYPWAATKIMCIHLGGDALNRIPVTRIDDRPYCLVVGNITPNKNIETILAAIKKVNEDGIGCRLIVAGSDLFGLLARSLENISIPLDIEILERVDDNVLAALYANAVCLIQASHYEGFGLPVIEAMNIGCPVIASDIPVLREVGGDAAVYFSSKSSNDLSKAIRKVLGDKELRLRLLALGRDNASRFRWLEAALQTAELFDRILGPVP